MAKFDDFDLSYTVSSCDLCHFVYASHLPAEEVYSHYYSKYSKYDVFTAISQLDALRFSSINEIISPLVSKEAIIFDVGCGSGALLSVLAKSGFSHLIGIDPAANAARFAKAHFGINTILHGDLKEAALCDVTPLADLVMLLAVTEHLYNPKDDLQRIINKSTKYALMR